jgi:putative membrane protein
MGGLCGTGFGWALFMVLFWAVVIVGLGFLVWWLVRLGQETPRDTAVETLRERYARGEVSREEFEARRRALGG